MHQNRRLFQRSYSVTTQPRAESQCNAEVAKERLCLTFQQEFGGPFCGIGTPMFLVAFSTGVANAIWLPWLVEG